MQWSINYGQKYKKRDQRPVPLISYWREHPCYLQYHPGSEFFLILTTLANLFAKLRIIYEIVIDNA